MNYKVMVLDIDGTLNNSQKEISKKTKNAITKAQENGLIVVIASGRPPCGINHIVKELELEKYGGYVLAFNGGRIINCKTNEVIYEKTITQEYVSEIYDVSKEFDINILTYSNDVVIAEFSDEFLEIECRINRTTCQKVSNFKSAVTYPVPKFLMTGNGDYLAEIEPLVRDRLEYNFNVFRSEPHFIEIMPKNIDKAYSLEKLLEHLGLTKSEMIACGDGFNDVSMISFAGLGVAMANAKEPVKEVADFITLSNDEDGIAHVIEKFIFN